MLKLSQYTVITGHYGSGKTNLAVNLAVDYARQGEQVTIVDLDIVNPYFRSADFKAMFDDLGIRLVAPPFANSNLDIPVISAEVFSVFVKNEGRILFDVGGDDAGAVALGMFRSHFESIDYDMLYVINRYRYLTRKPEEAAALLRDIETASRLKATGVANCSNLARETSAQDVLDSAQFAQDVCKTLGLPLVCTAVEKKLGQGLSLRVDNPYPVDIYVKANWD
ncbi:MAG: hypothetical protein ACERKO_10430 [Acetanaerobacterium sp.]